MIKTARSPLLLIVEQQDTKINKDLCGSSLFTSQTACLDSNGELEVCVMVKVLSKQERSKLLYDERGNLRSSDQVVGLLSRRIECKE